MKRYARSRVSAKAYRTESIPRPFARRCVVRSTVAPPVRVVRSSRIILLHSYPSFSFASRSSHAPHLTVSRGSRDRSPRRLGGHHRSGRLDDVQASDDGHVYDVCFLSRGRGKRGGFSRKVSRVRCVRTEASRFDVGAALRLDFARMAH
jgi:hypothetical protein